MTGKRSFYTDSLAAAWMAKHFGMRFQVWIDMSNDDEADFLGSFYDDEWASHQLVAAMSEHEKVYIHPDSLYLLEPQVGDILTNIGALG